MRRFGYQIIPVNPRLERWLDLRAVASLDEAAASPGGDQGIDIVNVFRQPAHVDSLVDDCIRLRLPAIWLQLGVVDEMAALRAQHAGMTVVMDRCILVDRAAMEA
jgi:predicted CoA-binding protein